MNRPWTLRATALAILAATLAAVPRPAAAQADVLKITQIEQDLRDLRRTVEIQGRRLDELERGPPSREGKPAAAAAPRVAAPVPPRDAPWLQAANWERVRAGAGELDVIAALGPPTSMRVSNDGRRRTLYYALEIGSAGYLGGNVVLDDRRVVAVELPRLR